MKVSVILTVKNEANTIEPLLDSLVAQTRVPDEIVICDAGSSDGTVGKISDFQSWLPIKLVIHEGANISAGRNIAIRAAEGPVIASTDAGVVLSPYWLEEIVAPIERGDAPVVSGWFEPDPYTDFEVVMGATVLPARQDVEADTFLPSSRSVAFLKTAWEAAGGYPEWLDYCEDLIFDLKLREEYGTFPLASGAIAYFRPRGSLRAFARQYYLYARGDGKANLWIKRHAIRYLAYLIGLPLIGRFIWRGKPLGLGLLAVGGAAYTIRPARRLWPATHGWSAPNRLRALALIPLIRVVGDVAKMIGYPVGVWWRWRNRS
jgi:glycosyltransferase involved in cell wall biosynthesis